MLKRSRPAPAELRTVADLRRALTVGTAVDVTNFLHDSLSGRRTVVAVTHRAVCIGFPAGHPRTAEGAGSWLQWPGRMGVRLSGMSADLLDPDGTTWCRLTVAPPAALPTD